MNYDVIDALITPHGHLDILSKLEVSKLLDHTQGPLQYFRNCSLAVLSSGSYLDDGKELLERYPASISALFRRARDQKLRVTNAPAVAFVDGTMIKGINEHLFSVLRDVIYVSDEINGNRTLI